MQGIGCGPSCGCTVCVAERMQRIALNHGPSCNCTKCISACQNQAYNRALQQAVVQGQGILGPGGWPYNDQLDSYVYGQMYKTAKTVVPVVVTPSPDEARIDEFLVGEVASGTVYRDLDCFFWFDDLPDSYAEGAKLLHASLTGEEEPGHIVKIKGLGSIRVMVPGQLFYIRLCI